MGFFYSPFTFIHRAQGQSVIKRAAYLGGERLCNPHQGKTYNYSLRTDVAFTTTLVPQGARRDLESRQTLWAEADRAEKRGDAILAREVVFPLYKGLSRNEQNELVSRITSTLFVNHGMCADIFLHQKDDGYSHAHVLLTTRSIVQNGFSARKNRDWDNKNLRMLWQLLWSDALNQALERNGIVVDNNPEELHHHGVEYGPLPPMGLGITIQMFLEENGINTDHLDESIALMDKRERTRNPEAEEYAFDGLPQ
jgi:hypothetical protein